MQFYSTRDHTHRVDGWTAMLNGLAPDGGLYVPASFPQARASDLPTSYRALASALLSLYLDGPLDELLEPYERLFPAQPAPLHKLRRAHVLELYHGPTAAFKDMALTVFPSLLRYAKTRLGIPEELVILTATSGDTGSAALAGFDGLEGMKIMVFYPRGGVSAIQEKQMLLKRQGNSQTVQVRGDFDACQRAVKTLFTDQALQMDLAAAGYRLSSANSINIGRLLPQIVYYYAAYQQLCASGELVEGELLDVVVPTGNFGNILAAIYAKQMGLPLRRIRAACNANSVVADFLQTGHYDWRRELLLTSSPSMDILVSSNLERFLALVLREEELIQAMQALETVGAYTVDPARFAALEVDGRHTEEAGTMAGVREIYTEEHYLIDPHTAVALQVAEQDPEVPLVVVSTASPYKFLEGMQRALDLPRETELWRAMRALERVSERSAPEALWALEQAELVEPWQADPEALKREVARFLKLPQEEDR